ncbi:sugar transporter [Teratosphaeria nubilosa]|uniref:Sugar transporter n=1 Tax=Teratosphaeria nubilosa TaxID=161662 RepID=A0A6G1KZ21_9PEZI|nr:sugar transporter [Teratosphaeria nubilosa]
MCELIRKILHNTTQSPSNNKPTPNAPRTLQTLKSTVAHAVAKGTIANTPYDRKAYVVNLAIQDIGMGRYQWQLFALCGFGWFADNFWIQGVALTLNALSDVFGVGMTGVRYTTLSLFVGLCVGASFWGVTSDVVGRRLAFNCTLGFAGVFGVLAGVVRSWVGVCAMFACVGVGIGGNLPVDGALFLEFLPSESANYLTMLSVWWPVGQLVGSLIAWPLLVNYKTDGWRYLLYTMGGMTLIGFVVRVFVFELFESPKYLLARGRQAESATVIRGLAYKNGQQTWLTEEVLNAIGGHPDATSDGKLSTSEIVRRNLSKFSTQRVGPLFATTKLGLTTLLIWICWTAIGMGYPLFNAFLPQYLSQAGGSAASSDYITYRNYAITSVVGVPGSIAACWLVKIPGFGRRGTMALFTVVTGVFLFCFTVSADPDYQLVFSSLEALVQNVAYGVLYAYTPEVFPAPVRGTASGISSFLNRLAGLCAPVIAVNTASADPKAPIYASGALFLIAFLAMISLPIETNRRQMM